MRHPRISACKIWARPLPTYINFDAVQLFGPCQTVIPFTKFSSTFIARCIECHIAAMTSSLQPRSARRDPQEWDRSIPPPLRPLVRAYALGYASAIVPRLFALVLQQVAPRKSKGGPDKDALQPPRESSVVSLQRILRTGLDPQRFPAFCAALVGGSTLLEVGETHGSSCLLAKTRLHHYGLL